MKVIPVDKYLSPQILIYGEDMYEISFEKGLNEVMWASIKRNGELILQSFLTVTSGFTDPLHLPFEIIVDGELEETVTYGKLLSNKILIFIDD